MQETLFQPISSKDDDLIEQKYGNFADENMIETAKNEQDEFGAWEYTFEKGKRLCIQ